MTRKCCACGGRLCCARVRGWRTPRWTGQSRWRIERLETPSSAASFSTCPESPSASAATCSAGKQGRRLCSGREKEDCIAAYLDLLGRGLEGVDGNDLLEPVQTHEHKGVVQLGQVRLTLRNVVHKEAVQGNGLAVHYVPVVPALPAHPALTRALPVLRQRRLLQNRKKSVISQNPREKKPLAADLFAEPLFPPGDEEHVVKEDDVAL